MKKISNVSLFSFSVTKRCIIILAKCSVGFPHARGSKSKANKNLTPQNQLKYCNLTAGRKEREKKEKEEIIIRVI